MGVDEWESLSWWQQRVYMEGLREEFYDPDHDVEDTDNTDWSTLTGADVQVVTS
jgi:hypothetical protein